MTSLRHRLLWMCHRSFFGKYCVLFFKSQIYTEHYANVVALKADDVGGCCAKNCISSLLASSDGLRTVGIWTSWRKAGFVCDGGKIKQHKISKDYPQVQVSSSVVCWWGSPRSELRVDGEGWWVQVCLWEGHHISHHSHLWDQDLLSELKIHYWLLTTNAFAQLFSICTKSREYSL